MGLTIAIYNVTSLNEFTLSYSETPYGAYTNFNNPSNGGLWESSSVRNYLENPILIPDVILPTLWIKIIDVVTGRYIIENIQTHDYQYFGCYYDCILEGNIINLTPPTPTPSPTPTPTPTPTATDVPPTPTPTPTATDVPPTPTATEVPPTPVPPTPVPPTPTPTPGIYYYNATEFTCAPNCSYIGTGYVISSSTELTTGKYYVGAGAVFLCTSVTTAQSSVTVIPTPYDTCGESSC